MKTRKINTKLTLNKISIARLNDSVINGIEGLQSPQMANIYAAGANEPNTVLTNYPPKCYGETNPQTPCVEAV